jgi:SOS response associated peptidase (SRAP)
MLRWHARQWMTMSNVREGYPEQRTAAVCHRRWHERARQRRAQLSGAVERCAEPRIAGHPPPLRWGLIPYWCQDPAGGRKPINAKCETVRDLPTFRTDGGQDFSLEPCLRGPALMTNRSTQRVARSSAHSSNPLVFPMFALHVVACGQISDRKRPTPSRARRKQKTHA